ncbi:MAG TPA: CarD family transcriptional regulator [Anaerolineales bacterium]|nr:CarD family transcriptional regulator [Anaerolineales bacterium]
MYQIGDRIIHRNYGPGLITGIEEKKLGKKTSEYYVVQTANATLWVPRDAPTSSLRYPLELVAFRDLLARLRGAGEPLPTHHIERGNLLFARMQSRTMPDLCRIIHDLTSRSRHHLLTKNDSEYLTRAQELLLNEWVAVLGITREAARKDLYELLAGISGLEDGAS